jgi:hypothetical protein
MTPMKVTTLGTPPSLQWKHVILVFIKTPHLPPKNPTNNSDFAKNLKQSCSFMTSPTTPWFKSSYCHRSATHPKPPSLITKQTSLLWLKSKFFPIKFLAK